MSCGEEFVTRNFFVSLPFEVTWNHSNILWDVFLGFIDFKNRNQWQDFGLKLMYMFYNFVLLEIFSEISWVFLCLFCLMNLCLSYWSIALKEMYKREVNLIWFVGTFLGLFEELSQIILTLWSRVLACFLISEA